MVFRELKEKINKFTRNLLLKGYDLSKDTRLTKKPLYDVFFNQKPGIRHPEIAPSLPLLEYVHNNSPSIKVATMRLRESIFRRGFEWERKFESKCNECKKEYEDIVQQCEECGSNNIILPDKNEIKRADDFFEKCNIYDVHEYGKRKLLHLLKQIEDDINIFDDSYLIGIKEYWQNKEGDIVGSTLHQIVRGNPVTMRIVADAYGEPGGRWWTCTSADTEVLTNNGWKLFKDVTYEDKIATLNKEKDELEYQNPTNIIEQPYNGNMVHINDTNKDILVTPDHQMYVKRGNKTNWEFKSASELMVNRWRIKRNVDNYIGNEIESFILPEYKYTYKSGANYQLEQTYFNEEKNIKMDDWLEFLGYYLSEGCSSHKQVVIYQKKYPEKIEECLKRLPFKYTKSYDKIGLTVFKIYSVQLTSYLEQFGLCYEKFIPNELLQLSRRQLKILFDALILGDGSTTNNRYDFYTYYTTSKRFADNVQEIMFKLGMFCIIKLRKTSHRDLYCITQYKHKINGRIDEYNRSLINYSGNVYCVTVPNGIIYVRRNGKPLWIGNCLRHRDVIEEIEDKKCPKCNRKLFEVHYVNVEGGGDSPNSYYIGDEVIHSMKYRPGIYGYSPIVTLWQTALTLTNMTEYIYRSYSEAHLPKGVLAMKTSNPDSAYEFWKDVDDKLAKDPHYIPKMFLEGEGNGTGSGMEFVKFMDTLEEMQYIPIRDEIRRTIASIYGVSNIFIGDMANSGGLNNESTQIDITNMAAEAGIAVYNEHIIPELLNWLHINDWEYILQSPFEENVQRELNENQSKVQIAQSMLQMGFQVELGEEDIFEFKYSGTAKKQEMGGFNPQNTENPQNMGVDAPSTDFGANPEENTPGTNENDLKMSIQKEKVYIKHPNEAPKGSKIQRSKRGSLYYERTPPVAPQRPNEQTLSMDKKRRIETLLQQANEHYKNILDEYKYSKDVNPGHAMSLQVDLEKTRNLIGLLHENYKELFNEEPVEKENVGRNININIQKMEADFNEIMKYSGEQDDIYQMKKFKAELNNIFEEEIQKIMNSSQKFTGNDIKVFTKKCLDDAVWKMNVHTKQFIQKAYASGQEYVGNLVKQSIDFSKVDKEAIDAILNKHVLWNSYENLAKSTSEQINTIITEGFADPKTFSINNLVNKMREVADSENYRLERIARTETHAAAMKGREISFQKTDSESKNLYKWGVRHDSRTSVQCKEIDTLVEKEGEGKGVPLSRLNEILKEVSMKYGGKNWQYRDWVVHPSCRSGLIRAF